MLPATISPPGPNALAHLKALGLDDESRFATIRQAPVIDVHAPTRKKVLDSYRATASNPYGECDVMLSVTPEDLAAMARNSNAMVAAGRLPVIKLGHTPLEDRPEAALPKVIGLTSNYAVCTRDGRPWLCCDLHLRRDALAEAASYPNISIERVDWRDPGSQRVEAVALLRREPERPVPLIAYGAGPAVASLRTCYGREVAAPPRTSPTFAEWCRSRRLPQTSESFRRFRAAEGRAAAEIEADAVLARRRLQQEYLDFATTRGIGDPREAQRRWLESRAGKG